MCDNASVASRSQAAALQRASLHVLRHSQIRSVFVPWELTVELTPRPTSHDPWFRTLVILLTIIAALYLGQTVWALVAQVGDLVVLFIVAWMISFILEPTVAALSQVPYIPRTLAVIIVYAVLFLAITSAAVVLAPVLAAQAGLAAEQLPVLAAAAEGWVNSAIHFLTVRGMLAPGAPEQLLRPVEALGTALFANAVAFATGAASAAVQILLVIIISLYLMLDSERIGTSILHAVPDRYRHDFLYFTTSVDRVFGGFLRGQIIQAIVYGVAIALMMLILNLKFVALASVLAGVAMFIPFLGPPLGLVPPILAALASETPNLWLAILLSLAINAFVVNAVAPKVMSQQIGLHPILVLAAFLVGARLAGPWGALLGVPVAAIIVTMVSFYQLTLAERRRRVLELMGEGHDAVGSPGPATADHAPITQEPEAMPSGSTSTESARNLRG